MKRIPRRLSFLLSALLLLAFVSCSDDDGHAPNLELAFADLLTDSEGTASVLQTDDGEQYPILNAPKGLRPDTVLRYICVFEKQARGVRLSSQARALCSAPQFIASDSVRTDSVSVQSIWRGSHYINLVLKIRGKDGRHTLGFVAHNIRLDNEGKRLLDIDLYHSSADILEAYSRTAYLSCDLRPYADSLRQGSDSILFHINEYGNAHTIYRLPY